METILAAARSTRSFGDGSYIAMKTAVETLDVFRSREEVYFGTSRLVRSALSFGGYDKGIVTAHPGWVTYTSNVNDVVLDGLART